MIEKIKNKIEDAKEYLLINTTFNAIMIMLFTIIAMALILGVVSFKATAVKTLCIAGMVVSVAVIKFMFDNNYKLIEGKCEDLKRYAEVAISHSDVKTLEEILEEEKGEHVTKE